MYDFQKRLHQALCEAYDLAELTIMVQYCLNQKIELISKGGRLDVVVFDLIQWAAPQARLADLPVHAAQFKTDKNSRVAVLDALRAEFEAAAGRPDPPAPASTAFLPEALANLLQTYESIPRMFEDGPARLTRMEQTADKVRALPLAALGLPDRLHLSPSGGERLAAVLALDQAPDPRYLRWLAERMGCEPPFVGLTAAAALTNAAYALNRGSLPGVRAAALAGLDLLPADSDRAKRQLQRAVQVADRRAGTMTRSQAILFDEVVAVLVTEFQLADIQSLLKAKLDIALDKLVRMTSRLECVMHDLLFTADTAGWDDELVRVALSARPASDKLKELSARYAVALGV